MSGLIGVDWGTSNLRAWHFDATGAVIDRRVSNAGIGAVQDGGFADILRALIGDWLDGGAPLLLGGMIGSRGGWVEVPYLPCPADPAALGAAAQPLPGDAPRGWVVPGLSHILPSGLYDVMRGEEVQIAGAGVSDAVVLLPGTHSKWARVRDGRILSFRTYMTGELFAVLRQHSLLGRLMQDGAEDPDSFLCGVRRGLADPALSALLFSARTEGLAGALPATGLADYLSGLLIGAELRDGLAGADGEIVVIATPALAARYALALREAGAPPPLVIDGEQAAIKGLLGIARCITEID